MKLDKYSTEKKFYLKWRMVKTEVEILYFIALIKNYDFTVEIYCNHNITGHKIISHKKKIKKKIENARNFFKHLININNCQYIYK